MNLLITLVVLCSSNSSISEIKGKMAEIQKQHPDAKVSVRFDKKSCSK